MNMTTETPLDVIRHVSQGNPSHNGPPPPPTGTPDQAVATGHPAFMRVVVRHLFGCTTLHLLPVPEAMSRGQAMTEVVRLRNEQTSSLVRYVEGIYVKDVIEVVSICNTLPPETGADSPTETAVLGPGTESPELTQALYQPHLFTVALDGPFVDKHQDVLTTASPLKALHVGHRIRRGSVLLTVMVAMVLALALGTWAGGLGVGFDCAATVGIVSGVLFWRFK